MLLNFRLLFCEFFWSVFGEMRATMEAENTHRWAYEQWPRINALLFKRERVPAEKREPFAYSY